MRSPSHHRAVDGCSAMPVFREKSVTPDLYRVRSFGDGFVAVMPRPRAGDWLEDEIAGLRRLGVSAMASLLEPDEARELGLESEVTIARQQGLSFRQFPIPDRSTPVKLPAYARFIGELAEDVLAGAGLAIHCRAGIGRSGLTAAATLLALGEKHTANGKAGPFLGQLRLAVTGQQVSPPLFESVVALGRARVVQRLDQILPLFAGE